MKDEQLYDAIFDDDVYVHGQPKKIKKVVKLTKNEKEQHDALIKSVEDAKFNSEMAMKKYNEHELAWDKLERNDKYWTENRRLVEENTEYGYLVSGAKYKLFMFEYNWNRRGYEEDEDEYPDSNLEIEASEDEMSKWDEEDPSWRIANDFD